MIIVRGITALFLFLVTLPALAADSVRTYPIDHVMGNPNAPMTIVEYASLTCGHCATFHQTVLPKLKAEWIDTGKAKLIFREYPTEPAAMSIASSMIAQCAGPERFFGVVDLLMASQKRWRSAENPLAELKLAVRLAGMSGQDVEDCLKRTEIAEAIMSRATESYERDRIDATPTIVVKGQKKQGLMSYDELNRLLLSVQ